MAGSTAGAVKAYLEGLGLGVSVHRDRAPEPAPGENPYPYITVREKVSLVPEPAFNQYDDSAGHVRELAQIDLWQQRRDPVTGARTEDLALADNVIVALAGARLPAAPFPVYGVEVVGAPRVPDPDSNVIHDAITVAVHRTLVRS